MNLRRAVACVVAGVLLASCQTAAPLNGDQTIGQDAGRRRPVMRPADPEVTPFIIDLQERTFRFFWERTNAENGLVPDRWPTESFSSVAAVGFGLTAYPIAVERGWITRKEAIDRVLTTMRFFWNAPHGPQAIEVTGYKGFYYHFLDMETGHRFEQVELSTIDTTLLVAGMLFCQSYFDRDDPDEEEIRELADSIYERIDWNWVSVRNPLIGMGWRPENGFIFADWRGLNEGAILYILALGSPTHPVDPSAWDAWTGTYNWGSYYGYEHIGFAPLFGHQYSQVWIDFRGIKDEFMREKGIDYFENSRRAVLSQRQYAMDNPMGWRAYGANIWGLSACDGPVDATLEVNGESRRFFTYAARGADFTEVRDDGTIAPTAAAASLPFAPRVVIDTLEAMHETYGEHIYSTYGFLDSFNPTFDFDIPVYHGRVIDGVGWVDGDYLGIDQGPIVAMIENYRSGLVWETMKKNPHIVRGLLRAGFTGGWLEEANQKSESRKQMAETRGSETRK